MAGAVLTPPSPPSRQTLAMEGGTPLWSVMIPSFNPTEDLREAVLSARAALDLSGATYQLEIVDDASTESDVESQLKAWGISAVAVYRRSENGGLGACWNACISRSTGRLIHILHQDDLVKPAFYLEMGRLAMNTPEAGMFFCRNEFLRERDSSVGDLEQAAEGVIDDWLPRIASGQRIQCPAAVVRRETYERVGNFHSSLRYVIDWEMWIRIAAATPVAYLPQSLATYRIHSGAETRKIKATGFVTRDFARGLRLIRETLRRAGRLDCIEAAEKFAVDCSIFAAQEAESLGKRPVAAAEIRASLRHLSAVMGWHRCLRQVRWYLRILLARTYQRIP